MSITLSQENISENGLNLKWTQSNLGQLQELTLIYYKSDNNSDINSMLLDVNTSRLNLPSLESGSNYFLQLQAFDGANTVYSNVLQCVTPYMLQAPVIQSVSGLDSSLNVTLAATSNMLSNADTVEFVVRRADNTLFWIVKSFSSNRQYELVHPSLINNTTYRIACMYQPAANNAMYKAPSSVSNTVLGTPTNLPNQARIVSLANALDFQNGHQANVRLSWVAPDDFGEWSNSFQIKVGIMNVWDMVPAYQYTLLDQNQNANQYTFSNVDRDGRFKCCIQYINDFGEGPVVESNLIIPRLFPDSPSLDSAIAGNGYVDLNFSAPIFNGNDGGLVAIKIYNADTNQLINQVAGNVYTYRVTGLTNGIQYKFYTTALNSLGESDPSNILDAMPYAACFINNIAVSGQTINISIAPNGKPLSKCIVLAVPTSSNDTEPFVRELDIVNQATSGFVNASCSFNFNINKYAVIVQGQSSSAYQSNI